MSSSCLWLQPPGVAPAPPSTRPKKPFIYFPGTRKSRSFSILIFILLLSHKLNACFLQFLPFGSQEFSLQVKIPNSDFYFSFISNMNDSCEHGWLILSDSRVHILLTMLSGRRNLKGYGVWKKWTFNISSYYLYLQLSWGYIHTYIHI